MCIWIAALPSGYRQGIGSRTMACHVHGKKDFAQSTLRSKYFSFPTPHLPERKILAFYAADGRRRGSSRAAFAKGDIAMTSAHKPLVFDRPLRGRIYDSIAETIGNTPLVRIPKIVAEEGITADIC